MSKLTYVELFAGAGGLSMGLEAAGFEAIAHAEIEPHARAVLRYRWPNVRLDGDVTQVNGADFKGVTLISGGSPCQDLSVAGKRAGLSGARSGLFYEQIRIWRESEAPYLLWENVLGALNSNKGHDFAAVLSAIVGTPVDVPKDGWKRGGVAAGRDAVAAWRVLDLQHFGPPQRRVRVFIVAARTGGVDPAEVLALSEGVCGHPSPREQSRQRAAHGAQAGAPSGSGVGAFNWKMGAKAHSIGWAEEEAPSVTREMTPAIIAFESTGGSWGVNSEVLRSAMHGEGVQCAASEAQSELDDGALPRAEAMPSWAVRAVSEDGANGCASHQRGLAGQSSGEPQATVPELSHQSTPYGRPRRLTPLEAERLMSWPDQWTATGIKEDGTEYALSDTARYRLCGNGVGSVCVAWFAKRLADLIVENA